MQMVMSWDGEQNDTELLLDLHRKLVRSRATEEALVRRYCKNEMRTPVHFGTGQEAVAVGVCNALRSDDVIFSHHRCHNHYLAKGGSIYELAAELHGRVDGCSRGRGGSVHLTAPEQGVIATGAIMGEMTAVAVGAGLAFRMEGIDRVAVSFFGEGAMDEGSFYEALNYAAIKKLPVLLVCENNLYSAETPLNIRQADGSDLCERARAFKAEAHRVDGNDVLEVYRAARQAVAKLRTGAGPVFLECMTYRWREHVGPMYDHEQNRTYRSRDELEAWTARCPISRSRDRLISTGAASADHLDALQQCIEAEVEHDVERARKAPWPVPSSLFDFT
jgi:pyruvate dehydrogenase E1 component alpha subunit